MGTKLNQGAFDCYNNALPDEPMFILLARDPHASGLVFMWSDLRDAAIQDGKRPESDRPMVTEAHECAAAMREWRIANDGRWRTEKAPPPAGDDLLAALKQIAQRANESGTCVLGERETIYAMHAIARAAIDKAEQLK